MKVIIIGGVAAGASAAARLRRLDEKAEIILLEKGDFISYANCGLPYCLGKIIPDRENLLVMPPAKFAAWFNINVRTRSEVIAIDRSRQVVKVRSDQGEYEENYDRLLIASGAVPQGETTSEKVMHLWTLANMDHAMRQLENASSAVIVGGGFIGLEAAESLRARNIEVTLIQRGPHLLPTLDEEMAHQLADELRRAGVDVRLNCQVKKYQETDGGVELHLDNGERIHADGVIVSTGVKPNSFLAQQCGLKCGERGHIVVNEYLQTSDPAIYAAGDVIEVVDPVFGGQTAVPLAGPANKQGRIAADNIAGGKSVYRGTLGTSVVKVGNLTAASVGWTEKRLKAAAIEFKKLYLHPASNASYYPGGSRMVLKLLFGNDGTIYGAQIVGAKGVDKRIDSIAQAMRSKLTAPELGELELAYAPPYSSAKDPVNFAGFVAANLLSGLSNAVYPDTIPENALILDVREPEENELGAIPGAVNIRLGELRERLHELDKNRLIVTCCQVGLRGYLAERILKQNGFDAANLSGGYLTWKMFNPPAPTPNKTIQKEKNMSSKNTAIVPDTILDVRSLPCPGPVIKLKAAVNELAEKASLHLLAPLTFEGDLLNWAAGNGHAVENLTIQDGHLEADVIKGSAHSSAGCSSCSTAISAGGKKASIVLFSNDFDKAMAALILANGLAASGSEVSIFFTFWGLSVLRKNPSPAVKKNLISRMFGMMLPKGAGKLALSKMNMLGMGSAMMKKVMKKQGVLSLQELIASARSAGVRFIACDMAMNVMGISADELIEVDEIAGVATFAELAKNSNNTLFI